MPYAAEAAKWILMTEWLLKKINKVRDNEIGRTYGTHEGESECMQDFGGKIRKKDTSMKT
jgi:hypothetical protein